MRMTVIPFVVGALGTIPKGLVNELEDLEIKGQVEETIQSTALLRSARIQRKVLETCCLSNSSKKAPDNAGVKKTLERINDYNNLPSVLAEHRVKIKECKK